MLRKSFPIMYGGVDSIWQVCVKTGPTVMVDDEDYDENPTTLADFSVVENHDGVFHEARSCCTAAQPIQNMEINIDSDGLWTAEKHELIGLNSYTPAQTSAMNKLHMDYLEKRLGRTFPEPQPNLERLSNPKAIVERSEMGKFMINALLFKINCTVWDLKCETGDCSPFSYMTREYGFIVKGHDGVSVKLVHTAQYEPEKMKPVPIFDETKPGPPFCAAPLEDLLKHVRSRENKIVGDGRLVNVCEFEVLVFILYRQSQRCRP